MAEEKGTKASLTEQAVIIDALREHCRKLDDGRAEYAGGMREVDFVDRVVMPKLANGAPPDPARRQPVLARTRAYRAELYGSLRSVRDDDAGGEEVAELRERVEALEKRLASISADFLRLVDNLGGLK